MKHTKKALLSLLLAASMLLSAAPLALADGEEAAAPDTYEVNSSGAPAAGHALEKGETHVVTITVSAALHAHRWDAGSVTTAPTETEAGVRTYTCSVCSGTKTEVIPATGTSGTGTGDDTADAAETVSLTVKLLSSDAAVARPDDIPVLQLTVQTDADGKRTVEGETSTIVTAVSAGEAALTPVLYVGEKEVARAGSFNITVSGIAFTFPDNKVSLGSHLQGTYALYGKAAGAQISWSVSDSKIAVINASGRLTPYAVGDVRVICSCTASDKTRYECAQDVTVVPNTASTVTGYLSQSGTMRFDTIAAALGSCCLDLLHSPLSYITSLSVQPSQGTLYSGYVSEADTGAGVSSSQQFAANNLSNLTYVPAPGYTGTAVIRYTGYSESGSSFSGEINVAVTALTSSDIHYSVQAGETLSFLASDFTDYSYSLTGRSARYVRFTPPVSSAGTLYYNYMSSEVYESVVQLNTSYYVSGTPSINKITFVPKGSFNGTVMVPFTLWDTAGASLSGNVRISVINPDATETAALSYTARSGQQVYFDESEFNDLSYELTDFGLKYIYFTGLPSSSEGVLWYGSNTRVSSYSQFHLSGNNVNYIYNLNFIAATNYEGVVTLPFTGVNTRGETFGGTVRVTVRKSGALSYKVKAGSRVYFEEEDFAEACHTATGYALSYIRFDALPQWFQGTLYCGSEEGRTATSYYYRQSSNGRMIRELYFSAAANYTGTFSIPFTGYNTYGRTYSGEMTITVTSAGSTISYSLYSGQMLLMDPQDFDSASYAETGYPLDYIRFGSTPTSAQGSLRTGTYSTVSTWSGYYNTGSSNLLKNVYFQAASNYAGTFELPFTGYSTNKTQFSGVITFNVSSAGNVRPLLYSSTGPAVTLSMKDFADSLAPALSDAPASVKLTAPDPSVGTFYIDYASPVEHSDFNAAKSYDASDLSRVSFLPKALREGSAYISYTVTDKSGNTLSNSFRVSVTMPTVSQYFDDVSDWETPGIDFLGRYDILHGTGGRIFAPKGLSQRAQFIVMLDQAFHFPSAATVGYRDVATDKYYWSAVAGARAAGVTDAATYFRPEDPITFEDAIVFLYRAMKLKGSIAPGTSADLSRFVDRDSVSPYAVEAMGALVKLGVVYGDDARRLNPKDTLMRSQMAALLYRTLA